MFRRFDTIYVIALLLIGMSISGCRRNNVPKPYGYFRITTPDTAYCAFNQQQLTNGESTANYPYNFDISTNAEIKRHSHEGDKYWVDIHYPSMNVDIHCSYKPVRGNLRELTDDAIEFIYKHASHASAIPERAYENDDNRVYGVFFDLEGNTASPIQFFLTDSTHHFFRGAVYANCRPNSDSLAPVFDYMQQDIVRMIETFKWQY